MQKIIIEGGRRLQGTIPISGAKNAALPLMAACLLTEEPLILENVPALVDIRTMQQLLAVLGVSATVEATASNTLTLQAATITSIIAPYELVKQMRASVLVLGSLLARYGEAKVSLPGGCAIGTRPVDLHIKGLEALGATITLENGYIHAVAPKTGLKGGTIALPYVSVGATENILMAAVLAQGESVIANAAREPEVIDLGRCLIAMGAKIEGLGTSRITVQGVSSLSGTRYAVLPDRIETGTYMIAAAMTGGEITLTNTSTNLLEAFVQKLQEAGVVVEASDNAVQVRADVKNLQGVDVMTEPYPGFPTDLQAQFMTLMSIAQGAAMITETIFENRFMHVPELCRMGANITVHNASALVRGVPQLTGAEVMATDLRASSCLVLAGLAAQGITKLDRIYHLDRGYDALEKKLNACGAMIARVKENN